MGLAKSSTTASTWGFSIFLSLVVSLSIGAIIVVATIIARNADEERARQQVEAVGVALGEHRSLFVDAANRLSADIAAIDSAGSNASASARSRALWPTGAAALRHERAFILEGTQVLEQYPPSPVTKAELPNAVMAFAARIGSRTDHMFQVNPTWSGSASGAANAADATDFVLVDGQPMIAAAAAIHASAAVSDRPDLLLVLLDHLDLRAISLIARMNGLDDMHFQISPPEATEVGMRLSSDGGFPIGWLVWARQTQVLDAFREALPYFAALSAIFVLIASFLGLAIDRSRKRLMEREKLARHEAAHDALTALPNRVQFGEELAGRLRGVRNPKLAVLYIDLDGFKGVNDTLGHPAGDELLIGVATRLRDTVRAAGIVARLGGDEFAVLLPDVQTAAAEAMAARLIKAIQRMMVVQGVPLSVGASIGIAIAPDHGDGVDDLLRRADIALYAAKQSGRGRAVPFAHEMERELRYRRYLERDLRAALLTGEISLAYQPIVSADGMRIVGAEALLRWQSPTRGAIPPSEFIAVAEETGFIIKLGAWALERACLDAIDLPIGFVSVNVSPVQMRSREIVDIVRQTLEKTGLDPGRLLLEVTESVLIDRADEALEIIRALRGLGVRIALDDFGSGYSSLAYLRRFPFDKLKMDKAFIETIGSDVEAATIVHAIISLGRGLGMTIVAEGVEMPEQHRFLRAAGCHEMQGYLFARPVPRSGLEGLLEAPAAVALSA